MSISQKVVFDRDLIDRYNRSGPRYTSYPTAPHFHGGFGPEQFRAAAEASNASGNPLSLYLHIPFCDTVCYYCACNRVVTPDRRRAEAYLGYLVREVERVGRLFQRSRVVRQLHFGGGTPTYLDGDQLETLMAHLARQFTLLDRSQGEYSIEVDPREVPTGTIQRLARLGFNRISFGVQDLEPSVQKAVNRLQPQSLNRRVVDEARQSGFVSINIDLMYGLPHQTVASFQRTLDQVIAELNPDRLAVFNYAHLPQYFMPQRRINEKDLPSPDDKLAILEMAVNRLTDAGYVFIGMDHFAKPQDEMAVAQREGTLHRNFQGYTTRAECDLVSMGATAISQVGRTYAQNLKDLTDYYARLDQGELTIFRGMQLSDDDWIRREVIMRLMCDFQLDGTALGRRLGIDFMSYFAAEWADLSRMAGEGLLTLSGSTLRVSDAGRLLIRNIAMVFDWYLRNAEQTKTFSRTI
ncbi:MAG: oxygen-independent coproporphyrinogen III oxidase [Magnetococcus sp. WYHC-3]